ncbi:MAG: hypothetical protein V1845_03925 [bacterium]
MRWIKDICRWFVISFLTNNNTRLLVCWIAVVVILLANLIVFGLGAPDSNSSMSETAQKYYNLEYKGKFGTDREIAGFTGSFSELVGWLWNVFRWIVWAFWLLLLIWSIIYVPIAFRDEAHAAWERTKRLITEKEGGEEELSPTEGERPKIKLGEKSKTSVSEGVISKIIEQIRIFIREFFAAVVADTLTRGGKK